jgi:hypothetical protein
MRSASVQSEKVKIYCVLKYGFTGTNMTLGNYDRPNTDECNFLFPLLYT